MCDCKTYKKDYERPPLGIVPRFISDEQRLEDIVSAIERFTIARKEIPCDWIEEYNELIKRM